MLLESKSANSKFPLSMKDTILMVPCALSGLLGFALSFSLLQPDGKPYLFIGCVVVLLVSLLLADKRKELTLGVGCFIALRLVWAAVVTYLPNLWR
jgi:hypothetical protein